MGKRSVRSMGLMLVLAAIALLAPTSALYAQLSDREGAAAGIAVLGGMLIAFTECFTAALVGEGLGDVVGEPH